MNKFMLVVVSCCMLALLTGCMGVMVDHGGIPSAPPGLITDLKTGHIVQTRAEGREYVVVKEVSAQSMSTCYLYLVSIGDVSYRTLKKAALENTDADDLIDVEIDGHQKSILGIINTVEVTLNAKAIKYTK